MHEIDTDIENVSRGFLAALSTGAFYDPPSADGPLDVERAYAIQRAFNTLRAVADPVCGYKAGVNTEAGQRALGLAGPVTGALFASGAHVSGARIERAAYRNLLIETELGFRTARRIERIIDSIAELRDAFATVAPMFELADPGFDRVTIRGADLIATNVACGGFVEGVPHPLGEIDINAVSLVLRRDGATLHEARAADLGGDHWQALRWLVNRIIERGEIIDAGQLLLTGALGPAQPAATGVYSATFERLGTVAATVV